MSRALLLWAVALGTCVAAAVVWAWPTWTVAGASAGGLALFWGWCWLLVRSAAEQAQEEMRAANMELERKLKERSDKLHAFAVELIRIEEEQRARIARELHDSLGQTMTAVNIQLQILHDTVPESAKTQVEDVRALATQVQTEMRRISQELRPAALDEMGLAEAIRALGDRMARHAGLEVDVDLPKDALVLPADAAIACYRLVQEALNNVAKHAGAHRAHVTVRAAGERVDVSITDDGRGIDHDPMEKTGHFGLMGLRERITALGGTFSFGPGPSGGTRLQASFPKS
jgi:signal transduction histidine kinase